MNRAGISLTQKHADDKKILHSKCRGVLSKSTFNYGKSVSTKLGKDGNWVGSICASQNHEAFQKNFNAGFTRSGGFNRLSGLWVFIDVIIIELDCSLIGNDSSE